MLRCECVAPENFRLWANWRRPTLAGCPFQAERRRFIRGELPGLGISEDMAEAIPRAQPEDDATAQERQTDQAGTVTRDPDLEEVELWDVHIAVDWDGNGRPSAEALLVCGHQVGGRGWEEDAGLRASRRSASSPRMRRGRSYCSRTGFWG